MTCGSCMWWKRRKRDGKGWGECTHPIDGVPGWVWDHDGQASNKTEETQDFAWDIPAGCPCWERK
jgi:hypothetical protein